MIPAEHAWIWWHAHAGRITKIHVCDRRVSSAGAMEAAGYNCDDGASWADWADHPMPLSVMARLIVQYDMDKRVLEEMIGEFSKIDRLEELKQSGDNDWDAKQVERRLLSIIRK